MNERICVLSSITGFTAVGGCAAVRLPAPPGPVDLRKYGPYGWRDSRMFQKKLLLKNTKAVPELANVRVRPARGRCARAGARAQARLKHLRTALQSGRPRTGNATQRNGCVRYSLGKMQREVVCQYSRQPVRGGTTWCYRNGHGGWLMVMNRRGGGGGE